MSSQEMIEISPGKLVTGLPVEKSEYALLIAQSWKRATEDIFEIARLCAEASCSLTVPEKQKLVAQLPFGESTFSKFVKIGSDQRLMDPDIRILLPPSYTIAYPIAQLTDEELRSAVKDNVIHPDMTRSDLQRWISGQREPRLTDHTAGSGTPEPQEGGTTSGKARPPADVDPLGRLKDAWDNSPGLVEAWSSAPVVVQVRFVREVLGMDDVPTALAA